MQKAKIVDNSTPSGEFQDSSSQAALDGTVLRAAFQNDNFNNLFEFVASSGYELIDDDVSQITKAARGLYNPSFTYNTSSIATQSVNDIVRGSDGKYYEVQNDAVNGDDPVGSITGNWVLADFDKGTVNKYVSLLNNQTIAGIKTFSSSPIAPTPMTGTQLANKDYVDANAGDLFIKPSKNEPLFLKVSPSALVIPSGFSVSSNGVKVALTNNYTLDLNTDLDTGIKTPGTDYYVYAKADLTFYISDNDAITTDRLIGGFHYGLTPENEVLPAAALKTEADMVTSRGIKAYSFWDLTWKPANKRPEGKVLVNNLFWRDIYPADEDYGIRGYSSCFAIDGVTPARIAGGGTTNGRRYPKIPISKGGNGTINYGSLTWYEANEIVNEIGMRMISYDEFSNSSYGVVEEKSLNELGYPTGTGVIQHYPEFESKWGVEMAVGVQYFWGSQIMNGYGSTDFAHRSGLTDGRGQLYATSNSPVAARLGGYELGSSTTNVAGSRHLLLHIYVWDTLWSDGFVAVCDHVNLDK